MADGRVLFAGGWCYNAPNSTIGVHAEIYDPTTRLFTPTTDMPETRSTQAGILLTDGRVALFGGVRLRRRLAVRIFARLGVGARSASHGLG